MKTNETKKHRKVSYIVFRDLCYCTRRVTLSEFGEVTVAGERLGMQLTTDEGRYVSDEARYVDNQIFFYVPDALLYQSNDKLITFLNKEVA